MNLYLLTRATPTPGYDETISIVVRAVDENDARRIAANNCGDEGPEPWLLGVETDSDSGTGHSVTCESLIAPWAGCPGKAGVVCRDFKAG